MSSASDRRVLSSPSSKPAFLERWQLPMPAELVGDAAADGPAPSEGVGVVEGADVDPDHHLWRNGRLWWAAITVLEHGWRQERVRVSLQTADLALARQRRDALIACIDALEDCQLSLRFGGRRQQARRSAGPARQQCGPVARPRRDRRSALASREIRVGHERRWQPVRTSVAPAHAQLELQGGSER
jgi:hypothetical protein